MAKYYNTWGKHYLPSLAGAHLLQQCNNFKDPGIQFYGGALFQKLRDEIEGIYYLYSRSIFNILLLNTEIFIHLPPPKPSIVHYDDQNSAAPLQDMSMLVPYPPRLKLT